MPGLLTPYGVSTERSEAWRAQRGNLIADQRAILDAAPDPDLSAEDQERYDKLVAEDERLANAIEREEAQAKRAADAAKPLQPTEPRQDSAGEPKPSARLNPRATEEYRENFRRFLRTGDTRGLMTTETRATADGLQADADTAGGFTYPDEQFVNTLIKFVDNEVIVRSRATVQRVTNADSLGAPSLDADPEDGDWTQELTSIDLDTQMEFGKRELRPHELTKGIKVSRKLLSRSVMDIESLVAQRLGYKISTTQETAFMTGNGVNRPLGLFTASSDGISTSRDTTAAATTSWTADNLIDTFYSVKAQYQRSGVWLMHRLAMRETRQLKDGNGQYLLQPGIRADEQDILLGRPVLQSEYAPSTFTTGLYVALFGDLSFYWIADAEDVSVQRLVELYAATNQIGFFIRAASDGMPVLEEAFARLVLA